jgi:hypothetical protein
MSTPLNNNQAAQFMADNPDAILQTPTPGSAVVKWNGQDVMITKDSIGNLFFTNMSDVSFWGNILGTGINIADGLVYVVAVGPVQAIEDYAIYLMGGFDQYTLANLADKASAIAQAAAAVAQKGAAAIGNILAGVTGPVVNQASGLLWAVAAVGLIYVIGHSKKAFPSLAF